MTMRLKSFFLAFLFLTTLSVNHAKAGIYDNASADTNLGVPEGASQLSHSPSGRELYVLGWIWSTHSTISVLDSHLGTVLGTIQILNGVPFDLVHSTDGKKVYVAISDSAGNLNTNGPNRVDVIDTATRQITKSITIGGSRFGPARIVVSPDGNRLYVSHRDDSDIYVIDTASETVSGVISLPDINGVAAEPIGMAVVSDSSRLYVIGRKNGYAYEINASSKAVIGQGQSGLNSYQAAEITIDRTDNYAYITSRGDNRIAVLDIADGSPTKNTVVAKLNTSGSKLHGVEVDSSNSNLFVVSNGTNEVYVIDINSSSPTFHTVTSIIPTGDHPIDISLHPNLEDAGFVASNYDLKLPVLKVPPADHATILSSLSDSQLQDIIISAPPEKVAAWQNSAPASSVSESLLRLSSEALGYRLLSLTADQLTSLLGKLSASNLCYVLGKLSRTDFGNVSGLLTKEGIKDVIFNFPKSDQKTVRGCFKSGGITKPDIHPDLNRAKKKIIRKLKKRIRTIKSKIKSTHKTKKKKVLKKRLETLQEKKKKLKK